MQWLLDKVSVSEEFKIISEFFLGFDFAGTITANFEFPLFVFFPFFRMVIAVFISIPSIIRIIESSSDCMVTVGSICFWFREPLPKPPSSLNSSNYTAEDTVNTWLEL